MIGKCPVCKGSELDIRGEYRADHGMLKGLKRVECRSCGMFFANPMPNQKDIDEYNSTYFVTAHDGRPQCKVANAFFSGIAKLRVAHLRKYLDFNNIPVKSILECGPGFGFFAQSWLDSSPSSSYYAIETDESCHAPLRAIGVNVIEQHSALSNVELDSVVMSHVLEHVAEPSEFISASCVNLKKGGALFIEVPCNDWKHKIMDEPHLLFFDKKPMHALLSSLGFVNIQISYHGTSITDLQAENRLEHLWMKIRSKLLSKGLIMPFGWRRKGMEALKVPFERAAVAPFNAHKESSLPAWWLRAVATKS
jgi:hypothetical protein